MTTVSRAEWLLQLAFALVLVGVMWFILRVAAHVDVFEPARLTLGYGFLLLEAYLFGELFARARLPKLSGYIVAGIVFGPHGAVFIDHHWAARMKLIDDLALTFIALTAGSELRLATLKARARTIVSVIGALVVLVLPGIALAVVVLGGRLPFTRDLDLAATAVLGVLIGVIAVARSPTSAIAIIKDCRARGTFTDTVLGVTVTMDSLVILLFACALSVGKTVVGGGALDMGFLGIVVLQLAASVALGAVVGLGVGFYIRRLGQDLSIFLVVLAFVVTETSQWLSHSLEALFAVGFHLEPLLIATAAGFVAQNFTQGGPALSRALHAVALPIFVVFFSMAGVHLNLAALAAIWPAALLFVVLRMVLVLIGGFTGCTVAGERGRFRVLCGLAFFTQAGVSLGLTQEVVRRFPEFGPSVGTFLVACITLNEIVGPITFKFALDRMGDSGRA